MAVESNRIIVPILNSVRDNFFEATASRTDELAAVPSDRCYTVSSGITPGLARIVTDRLPNDGPIESS